MQQVDSKPALSIEDIAFSWQQRGGFSLTVDRFEIRKGERVLLTAPSGAGKSTLISLIAGIVLPQRGRIRIDDSDIVPMRLAKRDRFRAENIGLIFQSFNLIPYLSALDNIILPLGFSPKRLKRDGGWSGVRERALEMLTEIGLPPDHYADLPASRLSLGQQQRVAMVRAMVGRPGLIIADEPTSALDFDRRTAFLDMLGEQLDHSGAALLMVSHDRDIARHFDRTVSLGTLIRSERAA